MKLQKGGNICKKKKLYGYIMLKFEFNIYWQKEWMIWVSECIIKRTNYNDHTHSWLS